MERQLLDFDERLMPMTKEEEIQLYLNCGEKIEVEDDDDDELSEDTPRIRQAETQNTWNLIFS